MARIEGLLKAAWIKEMKKGLPHFVVLPHQDVRQSGHPDVSVTGHGRTSWLEFKHGDPHFDDTGIQELTMLRLAAAGYARYVVYIENAKGLAKRTLIVHPKNFGSLEPEVWAVGFDHRFVVDFIKQVHRIS